MIRKKIPAITGRGLRHRSRLRAGSPAHDRGNAVKHVSQGCSNSPSQRSSASPAAGRYTVGNAGVNRIHGIEQIARAVGVLGCLSLPGRAGWAQATITGLAAAARRLPPSIEAVVLVKDPSPGRVP
jgi:hypothetical protein